MFRIFTKPSITQKKFFSSVINNRNVKTYVVDENLSRINAALACDDPPNYEIAITRGYALLDLKEKCVLEEALYAFDKALEFNPKSLSAHIGKSLIFNQLGLTARVQAVTKQLEKDIPNYLDLLSQIDTIKPRLPNLTSKTMPENKLVKDISSKQYINTEDHTFNHQSDEVLPNIEETRCLII